MHEQEVRKIMDGVRSKKINIEEAIRNLKFMPFEDLGFAKIDHHRALRKGFPEVVFCQNKTVKQVVEIVKRLAKDDSTILATRATEDMFRQIKKYIKNARYNTESKTIIVNKKNKMKNNKKILVASAG